ncbi:MAG: hypothetical protein HY791_00180 [Deltaproteobacteria bacterium]|nr:hypothetical protein [Deltaproteobacteria bacterium]
MNLSLAILSLTTSAFPGPRVAIVLDDAESGTPARARLEQSLQERGFEIVDAETTQRIRSVVTPKDVLEARLPEGLGVMEADAIVAGGVAYGAPAQFEGVESSTVRLTARLVDLATGRATRTLVTEATALGGTGRAHGASDAVDKLLKDASFSEALTNLGQAAGSVTLIVQDLPDRDALLTLKRGLERALGGAPVKEVYFAKGLGKLLLGGSDKKTMVGPDVADIIGETRTLALEVEEVANTRIVARHKAAKAVRISALVLEPKVPPKMKSSASELGRYVATHFAKFEFAKASYQPGSLSRADALAKAKAVGADVIVESEIMDISGSKALAIRVIDTKTGEPVFRDQRPMAQDSLKTAEALLATVGTVLPERLRPAEPIAEPTSAAAARTP